MNKIKTSQKIPDIEIKNNVINDLKKLFSENWSALLTKNEQTIVRVLYKEKSALNNYEIRRVLIFSTFYNIMNEFIKIHDKTSSSVNSELNNKKSFKNKKNKSEIYTHEFVTLINTPYPFVFTRFIEELKLSQYKEYSYFEFPTISARQFGDVLNRNLTNFEIPNKNLSNKNPLLDKLNLKLDYILANKTNAENFIIKVLSSLKVEIFGFSTITSILENLRNMKIVLSREVNLGKSKIAYFINPLLLEHIKE